MSMTNPNSVAPKRGAAHAAKRVFCLIAGFELDDAKLAIDVEERISDGAEAAEPFHQDGLGHAAPKGDKYAVSTAVGVPPAMGCTAGRLVAGATASRGRHAVVVKL